MDFRINLFYEISLDRYYQYLLFKTINIYSEIQIFFVKVKKKKYKMLLRELKVLLKLFLLQINISQINEER
jgi:hypothetical protein